VPAVTFVEQQGQLVGDSFGSSDIVAVRYIPRQPLLEIIAN
jgi:hypothetical protein